MTDAGPDLHEGPRMMTRIDAAESVPIATRIVRERGAEFVRDAAA